MPNWSGSRARSRFTIRGCDASQPLQTCSLGASLHTVAKISLQGGNGTCVRLPSRTRQLPQRIRGHHVHGRAAALVQSAARACWLPSGSPGP